MKRPWETNTGGQIWQPAPYQSAPMTTGSIQGIWADPLDDVEWIWTHTPGGSYVSGYTIKKKSAQETWSFNDAEKKNEEGKEEKG